MPHDFKVGDRVKAVKENYNPSAKFYLGTVEIAEPNDYLGVLPIGVRFDDDDFNWPARFEKLTEDFTPRIRALLAKRPKIIRYNKDNPPEIGIVVKLSDEGDFLKATGFNNLDEWNEAEFSRETSICMYKDDFRYAGKEFMVVGVDEHNDVTIEMQDGFRLIVHPKALTNS